MSELRLIHICALVLCPGLLLCGCSGGSREVTVSSAEYKRFFLEADRIRDSVFTAYPDVIVSKTKRHDSLRRAVAARYAAVAPKRESSGPGLLPFRPTGEPEVHYDLSDIRRVFSSLPVDRGRRTTEAFLDAFSTYVAQWRWLLAFVGDGESNGIHDLFLPKRSYDCRNIAALTCDVLKSFGMDCRYEYTPSWLDRPKNHYWCSAPDSDGVYRPFTPPENNLMEDWESDLKYVGKVYSITGSRRPSLRSLLFPAAGPMPGGLDRTRMKDRTSLYHKVSDVTLPLGTETSDRFAYLCFFGKNENDLTPVAWGRVSPDGRSATFRDVPLGTVLIPAVYSDGELATSGYPFMLVEEGGRVRTETIRPSPTETEMTLYRKYPDKRRMKRYREDLVGAVFLGGDVRKGPCDTLQTIREVPVPCVQDIRIPGGRPYRTYSLVSRDRKPLNIAELQLLGSPSENVPRTRLLRLPVFPWSGPGTGGTAALEYGLEDTGNSVRNVCDSDVLSYTGASRLVFTFPRPVRVTGLRFLPRNADNAIKPGDSYTLYFHDDGWVAHSTRTAEADFLTFSGVPEKTVYLLVDNTTGNEELPFFYENGEQQFINLNKTL